MKVNGKILYHIHKKNKHSEQWQVGKVIQTTDDVNYFAKLRFAAFYRISAELKKEGSFMAKVLEELSVAPFDIASTMLPLDDFDGKIFQKAEDLYKLSNELKDCLIVYIRFLNESIFEQIRVQEFPELPSRNSSFWLTDKKHLNYWLQIFRSINEKQLSDFIVFKVRATGSIHKTDGNWLTPDIYTISDLYERARKYWKGELAQSTNTNLIEYLFNGKLNLLEEISTKDIAI